MKINRIRKIGVAIAFVIGLSLIGKFVFEVRTPSTHDVSDTVVNAQEMSHPEVTALASNVVLRPNAGVSGPVEQGDAGFGALAYPFLWREAGVSGPVEQGDAGFGALAYPFLWREAGVSGPVEQGDAGFGALAYPFLWREAGVSGPVEQGDAGFQP